MQTNLNCEYDGFRTDLEGNRAKQEIDVYDNPGSWRTISGSWQPKMRFSACLTTQCGRHNCVSGRPCLIQLINSFSETTNPAHQEHDLFWCVFNFCSATIRLIHKEMYCAYYATYSHSCVAPYSPYDQLASS